MIPWILMIAGVLLAVGGAIGLLSILLLPIKERLEIVYEKDYDYIRSRIDRRVRYYVQIEKAHLTRDFMIAFVTGIIMFFAGIYLGFAEKGESFWFYKYFYPEETAGQVWDEINEEGKLVLEDGRAYTYYICVSGREIRLREERCGGLSELKNRLSEIQRENTVVLVDSFAAASTYHSVEDILNELGIDYEETRR